MNMHRRGFLVLAVGPVPASAGAKTSIVARPGLRGFGVLDGRRRHG